jgi:hypothetical protein
MNEIIQAPTSITDQLRRNFLAIPEKWKPTYYIHRYDGDPIEVDLPTRDGIYKALADGKKLIMVQDNVLSAGVIKQIVPRYGTPNIPPKPRPVYTYEETEQHTMTKIQTEDSKLEQAEWEETFGKLLEEYERTTTMGTSRRRPNTSRA